MSDTPPWGNETCTPGDAEWQRRFEWFMAQPSEGWWWLSFADDERPKGEQFLGLCIVPGGNVVQAGQVAWALGINPGGEVAGWALPRAPYSHLVGRLFIGEEGKRMSEVPLWDEEAADG